MTHRVLLFFMASMAMLRP